MRACGLAACLLVAGLAVVPSAGAGSRTASAERSLSLRLKRLAPDSRHVACRPSSRKAMRFRCRWSGRRHLHRGTVRVCTGTAAVRKTGRRWRAGRPASTCITRRPRKPYFGFNDYVDSRLSAATHADLARNAGADSVRITIGWNWAEPYPDDYRLGSVDQQYRASVSRGLRPLLAIMFSPWWTWSAGTSCPRFGDCAFPPDPKFDADWREFVALVARRYPDALGIEVWNEPNLRAFWKPLPDVARYTDLLKQAYSATKAANPAMAVITGGFATPDASGAAGGDVTLTDFTRGVYEHGGKNYMDGIGLHPYGAIPWRTDIIKSFFNQVRGVRDSFGDKGKPLWATEFGLSTTGDPWPRAWSEQEQAAGLANHYRAIASMPDVKGLYVHALVEPQGDPTTSYGPGYGIVHGDGTPKPAYCALTQARGVRRACPGS